MSSVLSMARQAVRGLPYFEKEVKRRVSLRTGMVLTTPMTYYVIFSGRCNLECTFCTIYKEVDPIIAPETMLRIIRETKSLSGSGFNISLSGGEPMIYKGLYDALALSHQLGVNFGFTTNALGLTKSNCEKILSHDPFNINVSLESIDPKVNESLRPMKDGTRRTLDGINNLLTEKERSGSRVSLIVKPTIMEQNYRGLPALVRHFGKDIKAQVHFQPYVGAINDPFWIKDLNALRGVFEELRQLRTEGYPVMLSDTQLTGFMEYFSSPPVNGIMRFLDLAGQKRNCDIGLRAMFVKPNGDVFFCDYLGHPVGNIYKENLGEIYYGAIAKKQREQMVFCNIDCQQTCKRPIPLAVKAKAFLRMG
jgi:MoaA/NifB/PqqE/SkfB family radical SAM enzyme